MIDYSTGPLIYLVEKESQQGRRAQGSMQGSNQCKVLHGDILMLRMPSDTYFVEYANDITVVIVTSVRVM